jgi:SAM-dependent methyltransferase
VKLHLGCGKKRWEGFVNVDIHDSDMDCDVRCLPLNDCVADEIHAIHVAEHFFRHELPVVLAEWCRVLKPGGKLVVELPCWDKVKALIAHGAPENMTRWALYGEPRTHVDGFPALHKWCWGIGEFRSMLIDVGFVNVEKQTPLFHQPVRDMRFVAWK